MSAEPKSHTPPPLDLSKWRKVPDRLMTGGFVLVMLGLAVSHARHGNFNQFGYSWLQAFMFFLSLGFGGLFLVLVHHLFDAGWSVPIRRFCEHIACLLPWMAIFFIPIALLATHLYPWMGPELQAKPDHALHAKMALLSKPIFYVIAVAIFAVLWLLTSRLRYWSLEQDKTGEAKCTYKMRFHAAWGIFAFAITLTFAAIMWMKALQHDWFSTMYGVWYFAGSVWMTVGTVYIITMILDRQKVLTDVLHEHQYYFLGSVFFAFTVFYAYITFAQYFIIWNANVPEETFWYVIREKGSWFCVSMIIIFGHFFLPFLAMLRIDVKKTFAIMVPLGLWAWLMHYFDLSFNIMPVAHPNGFAWKWMWLDFGCMAFIGGILAKLFLRSYNSHPPFPQKDPRLGEAMGFYHPVPTQISGGELDEADENLPSGAEGGSR